MLTCIAKGTTFSRQTAPPKGSVRAVFPKKCHSSRVSRFRSRLIGILSTTASSSHSERRLRRGVGKAPRRALDRRGDCAKTHSSPLLTQFLHFGYSSSHWGGRHERSNQRWAILLYFSTGLRPPFPAGFREKRTLTRRFLHAVHPDLVLL